MEIPISAPNPNCSPSVNAVEALTITAALSTRSVNSWAALRFVVTMASVCPLEYRSMCSIAASRPSTSATAMSNDRYSAPKSSSVTGTTPGTERSACTVTPAARKAPTSCGTATSAMARSINSVSAALHTLGRRVLEFNRIRSASARSASACTYTWQLPTPVSMVGTCASRTTASIRPAPPRGITTSTSPRAWMR
ncbi:Uncharacterised protein [Mycobacteroides abscessus subsp. abscessus]|nr:Uncharacterised protein [Mycobacteroides abscessus subsp. abscessus]